MAKEKEGAVDDRRDLDERHVKLIRAFRNDQALECSYLATALNPYSDGDIDIYDDQHGFEYWVDPSDGTLVIAAPRAGVPAAPAAVEFNRRVPVGTLRDMAVALITGQVPDFEKVRAGLRPYEDNRRSQIFFFRWEEVGQFKDGLPPFIQAGMNADGTLACYANTLNK